jgi:hypothetical protein
MEKEDCVGRSEFPGYWESLRFLFYCGCRLACSGEKAIL